MNISDKQLTALINYIRIEAQVYAQFLPAPNHEVKAARKELCKAFGFQPNRHAYPETPVVPQTAPRPIGVPPELYAPYGGPTTKHQQAQADADYDDKHEAIFKLLNRDGVGLHDLGAAAIMRLWPALKAIMEPECEHCDVCNGYIGHVPVPGERCPCCDNRMGL